MKDLFCKNKVVASIFKYRKGHISKILEIYIYWPAAIFLSKTNAFTVFKVRLKMFLLFIFIISLDPKDTVSDTLGSCLEQTWICDIWNNLCKNSDITGYLVLKKIFKTPHPIFIIFEIVSFGRKVSLSFEQIWKPHAEE